MSKKRSRPDYNYRFFGMRHYDLRRFDGPVIGRIAPDAKLYTPSGKAVRLSDFRGKPVVIESGCRSCPLYRRNVDEMQALEKEFPQFEFIVLFSREAHPGERMRAHDTMTEKRRAARDMIARDNETRTVLVDKLSGAAHLALGGHPNLLYILDANGVVQFRAQSNTIEGTRRALERLSNGYQAADVVSRYQPPSVWSVLGTLRKAGWLSVLNFIRALPKLAYQLYIGEDALATRRS
jgi:hypothetical protein